MELAVKQVITDSLSASPLSAIPVYTMFNNEDMDIPCFTVGIVNTDYELIGENITGNVTLEAALEVWTNYEDDSLTTHSAMVTSLKNIVINDSFMPSINNQGLGHIMEWHPLKGVRELANNIRRQSINVSFYVMPSAD